MRKEIDIDELMAETWLTVTMLKHGGVTPDGAELYGRCCRQIEGVRKALAEAGYDEASIAHISYAQCALLDETVMSRQQPGPEHEENSGARQPDIGQAAWRQAPLQARYFGSLRAGEALWDRIAEVLKQPAPVQAVLTCYHRTIALGFQGLYSLNSVSQSQRDEVMSTLAERVPALNAGLSLMIHPTGKRRYSMMRSVWFWIVCALVITGVVWWGGHLWLQSLLATQIPEPPR